MEQNLRKEGAKWEQKAGSLLEQYGYEILEYNFRCRQGEVDIVAREDRYLVFVEVKYRSGSTHGTPQAAVDLRKQKRICHAALFYLSRHGCSLNTPVRFDVVAFFGERAELFRNAFEFFMPRGPRGV